ncbi:S1C family serine protease [Streptomyces thermolilacinus]|uniref:Protease n=1 Tax=Streptomyces thermolilacinus SPC6 TaxID=1306406 RepID=A0A1D3DQF0_9ACTN|nr:trypsin-like peptidase domain-containing protein [Streptomyces thermolilacinus]OEJ94542.1 protease [Streptomyces thermolilacinus SPC6]
MDDGKPTQPKRNWWSRPTPPGAAAVPSPAGAPQHPPAPTAAPEVAAPSLTKPSTEAVGACTAGPVPADAPDPVAATAAARSEDGESGPGLSLTKGGTAQATDTRTPDPAPQPPAPTPTEAAPTRAETPTATEAPAGSVAPSRPAAPTAPAVDAVAGTAPASPEAPAGAPSGAGPVPEPPAAGGHGVTGADARGARTGGPLHAPDEYRTPPYGEPGPWAPAPPVQRPVLGRTPAYGTPAPAVPHGHPTAPAAPAQPQVPVQWGQYDPWNRPAAPAHAQQPLTGGGTGHGGPGGTGGVGGGRPRGSRKGLALVGALLFALLTGVLGGAVGAYVERNGGLTTVELPQAGAGAQDRAPDSVAGIAARALPSVVTLHVSGGGAQGTGTGFVLDKRGHILTNHHVVDSGEGGGDITVTFSGGETARATLVGGDSGYDLAVVRVTGVRNLQPLPLGNSDGVRVGDPVVAIGAPFDLQNTVTSGIISAKGRPITAGGEKGDGSDISYVDALQTDAPINPGNSGGPLLDAQARVIGINSAIRAADSGSGIDDGQSGSIGLGFAIPVNQGKRVAEELINTGKATHPVIGVSLDMKFAGDGARVADKAQDGGASVTPGGPAAEAGIRPGDVITKVDGERVHSGEELIVKIRAHRPGDELRLTVRRGTAESAKTLTLGSSADG